jgi:hypothetical protein
VTKDSVCLLLLCIVRTGRENPHIRSPCVEIRGTPPRQFPFFLPSHCPFGRLLVVRIVLGQTSPTDHSRVVFLIVVIFHLLRCFPYHLAVGSGVCLLTGPPPSTALLFAIYVLLELRSDRIVSASASSSIFRNHSALDTSLSVGLASRISHLRVAPHRLTSEHSRLVHLRIRLCPPPLRKQSVGIEAI